MEDDENNFAQEIEERLYAEIYHDSNIEIENPAVNTNQILSAASTSNKARYWQDSKRKKPNFVLQRKQKTFSNHQQKNLNNPKTQADDTEEKKSENDQELAKNVKPFVPYTSVLSFMNQPQDPESSSAKDLDVVMGRPKTYEKKKSKMTKFPKEKAKFLNPMSKQVMKEKYAAKKIKAEEARKKASSKKIVFIDIDSSSDSDSVIPIETPAPPLITLDSSDDEIVKKLKRALSPSTSSMISDDFVVAGDKRRLANPFASPELQPNSAGKLKKSSENVTANKVKALTKFSSSSSNSNSARSSCERNISNESIMKNNESEEVCKEKVNSSENSNEDSIYTSKAKAPKKTPVVENMSSSDDEHGTVVMAKTKRRKSTGSRKKSSDKEEPEVNEEARLSSNSSTSLTNRPKKRSRFHTPSYNEAEFASLIHTVMQRESDEESANENEMTVPENNQNENDCEIVENPPQPTFVIDDEGDSALLSDSDDSMRNFKAPVNCDLSLNVTEFVPDPHEFMPITKISHESKNTTTGLDCEVGWNDEMKYFYSECTDGRDFNLTSVINSMPRDPNLWQVNVADRSRFHYDGERRVRCRNCNEIGHIAVYCKRPKKRVVCFMCGEDGHRETRCPNSICLRCGKPNKIFSSICTSCNKSSKKVCPLCRYKGHDIDQCPDKWRRYHSTTTVDDKDLDISFKKNPRIYCSICARRGHFAEGCSQFNKAICGLITSSPVRIISNKQSYPKNSFNGPRENPHIFQIIGYMENYFFNFKLPANCQLYPQFKERYLKHLEDKYKSKHGLLAIEGSQRKRKRINKKENGKKSAKAGASESSPKGDNVSKENVTPAEKLQNGTHDDNSNYSFSEFYQNPNDSIQDKSTEASESSKTPSLLKNPFAKNSPFEGLPDFIPIGDLRAMNGHKPDLINNPKAVSCVMLTKQHASILMSPKGQDFLFDLSNKLNVMPEFKWDKTGNSIVITGMECNHSPFHLELRAYIYKIETQQYEAQFERCTQVPKTKLKVISYLKGNLQSIKNSSVSSTKKLLENFVTAEKSHDHKKALKCRKALNIAFMGYAELNDGGKHLGELRRILFGLEREAENDAGDKQVTQTLRDEISMHIKYIFSSINHGDYCKMFEEFKRVMQQRNGKKFLPNPLNFRQQL